MEKTMKVFIINSLRLVVYIGFVLTWIGYIFGAYQHRIEIAQAIGAPEQYASAVAIGGGVLAGWIVSSVVFGIVATLLDIRDDVNDRLPDARKDPK
jgi:hypothetical protein